MCRYYFYERISTAEDRDLQSYARQHKALEKYAKENGIPFDNHNVYKDDKSGKTFDGREEWFKIENDVRKGDTIIFKDISRFTREYENGYDKYMKLFNMGVNLVFLDNMSVSTSYIKAMMDVAERQASRIAKKSLKDTIELLILVELDRVETERETLSKRIHDGIMASDKKSGRPTGQLDKMSVELQNDIDLFIKDRNIKYVDLMNKYSICRNTLKKYIDARKKELLK